MKVERQDIVLRHERDVIVLTGPDGSLRNQSHILKIAESYEK